MKIKKEASDLILKFITQFDNQSRLRIKKIISKNVSELNIAYETLAKKGLKASK